MELIAGTYDQILLGFRVVEVGKEFQIETSFTDHTHSGCIRAVAVSNKGVLASAGTDEIIRLINLRKERELGSLVKHSGTVTDLQFHKQFLFSTSEDCNLCLWKSFTWECLRTFKGHKGSVNSVSVHPSGKLALTVGKDKALHTWNLIKGRSAYTTNIKKASDFVRWSPGGNSYLIVADNKIDIYTVEAGKIITTIEAAGRVNGIQFLNEEDCVYGGEGGTLTIQNTRTGDVIHTIETNTSRIKGICVCCSMKDEEPDVQWLSIGSSDGYIKIYSLSQEQGKYSSEMLAEHNTGFRITCLTVFNHKAESHEEDQLETADNTTTEITQKSRKTVTESKKQKTKEDKNPRKRKAEERTVANSEGSDEEEEEEGESVPEKIPKKTPKKQLKKQMKKKSPNEAAKKNLKTRKKQLKMS